MMGRTVLLGLLTAFVVRTELVTWGMHVPRRVQPPVVFVTGHDAICPDARSGELPFFNLTFGNFDKVINESGRVAMVFEMCYAPNRPGLDTIAAKFSELAGKLLYEDGEPVREVDVVAHSLGGLMVRSYLAQGLPGPRIRKVVFLGVPHFGTGVAAFADTDPQLRQVSLGSQWLFELATWNQGTEDLRGAEAIALAGTAGVNNQYGVTDSVVTVNSGSLDFVAPGRTVVLPLCHTQGGIGQLFLCAGAAGIANVRDAKHPTAQIALTFLNGTGDEWRSVAQAAGWIRRSDSAGLIVQRRNADNSVAPIQFARLATADGKSMDLARSSEGLAFALNAPEGVSRLSVDGQEVSLDLRAGGSKALLLKPGPFISSVEPLPGATWPLTLAPGMLVRIRGRELADLGRSGEVRLGEEAVRVLRITPEGDLIAVLPNLAPGIRVLTVRTSGGEHSVGVVLEAATPALLKTDAGITAALPFDGGRVFTLFLTGLGAVRAEGSFLIHTQQPEVRIGGQPCAILYSGQAGALPGVDQINCRLQDPLPTGPAEVVVRSGARSSSGSLVMR